MRPGLLVDYGGSSLRFFLVSGAKKIALSLPSRPLRELPALIARVVKTSGAPPLSLLAVGARGVWKGGDKEKLRERLSGLARDVRVYSDAELAYLRVLGLRPGILVLAGTGSIALGKDARGRLARAGGLGPKKGDEGSGYWIGKMWRGSKRTGGQSGVRSLAALAPHVIKKAGQGNADAGRIVRAACLELAGLAQSVRAELGLKGDVNLGLSGGLFKSAAMRCGLRRELRRGHARGGWILARPVRPEFDARQAERALKILSGAGRPRSSNRG